MDALYPLLKTVHILSAIILFGTGLGTAFHMWLAHLGGDARVIARVAKQVVWADMLFTAPAVVVQPLTGVLLLWQAGFDPVAPWLVAAYALYVLAGACWLPVLWLQVRARDLALDASVNGHALPAAYGRVMRWWFYLGWPAFLAMVATVWLMVAKPHF